MKISPKRLYKEYPYEASILTVAGVIIIVSVIAVVLTSRPLEAVKTTNTSATVLDASKQASITLDISGEVNNPDIYSFSYSPRIKEVIERAGGFTEQADREFINRNFNMARYVNDQEKVYIPSVSEIRTGIFTEESRSLQYLSVTQSSQVEVKRTASPGTISINSATAEELDSLEGIGTTLSKSIIEHRPYTNINELVSKKVLKQNVFTKIKDSITL